MGYAGLRWNKKLTQSICCASAPVFDTGPGVSGGVSGVVIAVVVVVVFLSFRFDSSQVVRDAAFILLSFFVLDIYLYCNAYED